jgi:hypothetical protein
MADELEIPDHADQLFLARGADEVSSHRPIFQGDVFDNVSIPGVEGEPTLGLVTTYACDMRGDGAHLSDRIDMVRIEPRAGAPEPMTPGFLRAWFRGNFGQMPLPDLKGEGAGHFMARLELQGRVEVATLGERLACLQPYGICILQQRIVNRSSRVRIAIHVFEDRGGQVFTEADLMEEWFERSDAAAISRETAESDFHNFLTAARGDEPSLQRQLRDEGKRPYVSTIVREELRTRFP